MLEVIGRILRGLLVPGERVADGERTIRTGQTVTNLVRPVRLPYRVGHDSPIGRDCTLADFDGVFAIAQPVFMGVRVERLIRLPIYEEPEIL